MNGAIDFVNHPAHYTFGKYEVIDVLMDWFPSDPLLWQVGKYIARAGRKGDALTDLQKAVWYLNKRIEKEKPESEKSDEQTLQEKTMKQKSLLMKLLAEESKKISRALKTAGYETIKIDIAQIRNAEEGSIDIQIWARTEEKR